jgi:NAD(P)-dependent dehydrogenase (short-subunit alcohol dehydrogenase family)
VSLQAIITGGAQGLGYAIAEYVDGPRRSSVATLFYLHLVTNLRTLHIYISIAPCRYIGRKGAAVALFDMVEDRLREAVGTLTTAGITASYQVMNVTLEADWEKSVAAVLAAHPKVDILVQAAGITGKTGIKTHEVDPSNFDAVFGVNAKGVFLGCRAVLPGMVKENYGRIVNIASVAGKEGNAGMLAYSGSKGAVIAMTKAIGKEYAETGITCNALAPAVVRTAMVDAMPAEQVKYMTDKIPMKRCAVNHKYIT